MKISLLCPTRGRPDSMERMWNSAVEHANYREDLECVFYVDNDDQASEEKATELGCEAVLGPRIVLSEMWNACYYIATGEIFMHCGDDLVFHRLGWDRMVVAEFEKYPDRIAFVHGRDGIANEKLGTHGFIHQAWVDAVGYFVPPYFSSLYNDTWLTEVANRIDRRVYLEAMYIEHLHFTSGKSPYDATYSDRRDGTISTNAENTTKWNSLVDERIGDAAKLQEVIDSHNEDLK